MSSHTLQHSLYGSFCDAYPFIFEGIDGPTFQRIALAAMLYHDPDSNVTLKFKGRLRDYRDDPESGRFVTLTAQCWGFSSGTDYERGEMTLYLSFNGYRRRGTPSIGYNFRNRRFLEPIELARRTRRS